MWRSRRKPDDYAQLRRDMVSRQIAARGVRDAAVLAAMREVPRECFVPPAERACAYDDSALPLARGQTVSQPYVVALMTAALELSGDARVLEVGTGSGYGAAVLSRIAATVYTVERLEDLAEAARARFAALGYDNIEVRTGDGTLGWPDAAPFAGIVVTAAAPVLPATLATQLAPGGRMVVPIGSRWMQDLVCITRAADGSLEQRSLCGVRFVPLLGKEGWSTA